MFNSPPFFLKETHLIWQSRYGISENKTRGIYERERERERERRKNYLKELGSSYKKIKLKIDTV